MAYELANGFKNPPMHSKIITLKSNLSLKKPLTCSKSVGRRGKGILDH